LHLLDIVSRIYAILASDPDWTRDEPTLRRRAAELVSLSLFSYAASKENS
jgi:hypothetical protein